MATEAAGYHNPDDWDLIYDDGFVYKRKKRPRLEPLVSAPPLPDPVAEREHRRERRTRALLKLRQRYAEEITRWELLSNTLTAIEENSQAQSVELRSTTSFDGASSYGEPTTAPPDDSSCQGPVDDLLSQVEAQEAIIRKVLNLCDIVEGLFSAEEERSRQQLIDLAIWDPSPHELMAALCHQ